MSWVLHITYRDLHLDALLASLPYTKVPRGKALPDYPSGELCALKVSHSYLPSTLYYIIVASRLFPLWSCGSLARVRDLGLRGAKMKKHINQWGRASLGKARRSLSQEYLRPQKGPGEERIMKMLNKDGKYICRERCSSGQSRRPHSFQSILNSTDSRRDGLELAARLV